jgi:multiple sugar transport system permease protein
MLSEEAIPRPGERRQEEGAGAIENNEGRTTVAVAGTSALARPRRSRWLSPLARKEAITAYVFLLPWIIGFLWFTLYPLARSLYLSFTNYSGAAGTSPIFIGLSNFEQIFSNDPTFWQSVKVTLIYSFLAVPLGLLFSLSLAILLNQKIRFLPVWRTIYYMPSLVTGAAVALLWQFMFNQQFGIINYVIGLIGIPGIPWLNSEFWIIPALVLVALWGSTGSMLIFLGGLQSIPTELYEAAMMDGAGRWRKFWQITIPMLTPSIFFNLIFGIIASFQVFDQVFLLTGGIGSASLGGPNYASYVYAIYLYQTAFQYGRIGYAAALGWIMFVALLAITLFIFRTSTAWVYYAGAGDR